MFKLYSIFVVFLLFSIVIKSFVFDIYTIPTASMQPTLQVGDKILLQKCFFSIQKNDIVAFYFPQNPNEKYIKRCAGMPLDTLLLNEKNNYFLKQKQMINDKTLFFIIPKKGLTLTITLQNLAFYKPLIEQSEGGQIGIINNLLYINGSLINTYTFKKNYYFMLGDNPIASNDSRQWGVVCEDLIFGKTSN